MLICQITDLHVVARGQLMSRLLDTPRLLEEAVAHVNAMEPRPDVVLATGDLAADGRPEEYETLRAVLAGLAPPVYLLPGNHDDRDLLRAAFPDHGYLASAGEDSVLYAVEGFPLRLVGLDTTVKGEPGGQLGARRLDWLYETLAAAPDRPTAIFMHHPPFFTGMAAMDAMRLADIDPFWEVLADHRQVSWVFCGHLHRPIQHLRQGVLALTAPATSFTLAADLRPDGRNRFVDERPACLLHLWHPERGLVSHLSPIGSRDLPKAADDS